MPMIISSGGSHGFPVGSVGPINAESFGAFSAMPAGKVIIVEQVAPAGITVLKNGSGWVLAINPSKMSEVAAIRQEFDRQEAQLKQVAKDIEKFLEVTDGRPRYSDISAEKTTFTPEYRSLSIQQVPSPSSRLRSIQG